MIHHNSLYYVQTVIDAPETSTTEFKHLFCIILRNLQMPDNNVTFIKIIIYIKLMRQQTTASFSS